MEVKKQIPILGPDDFGRKNFFGDDEVIDFQKPVNKLFHINRIEDHPDLIRHPMPPHQKTVYIFIFFLEGSTIRSKGLDTYSCEENTFFFLPPFQTTSRKQQNIESKGFYCHFDPEIFQNTLYTKELLGQFAFLDFLGSPLVKIDDAAVADIVNILERIEAEYLRVQHLNLELISAYLLALFIELKAYYNADNFTSEKATSRITRNYKDALMCHIHDKQKVTEYADLLSVTTDYLNRCVKATTGKTAHQLLDDMLILEAKVLLNQTSYNISEIAYRIGKSNVSDFIRFFKSKTRLTPKQYRQKSVGQLAL